jgi:hypothetical protein
MNQLDLKLSATLDMPLASGWTLIRRSLPRGLMLLALTALGWAAVGGAAWFFFERL